MGNESSKTNATKTNPSLNGSNSSLLNPSHIAAPIPNNSMNNIMPPNQIINQNHQNPNHNFGGHREQIAPQEELTEDEKKKNLEKQVEDLEKDISYLGSAYNMKFNLPKEKSETSANFVARYKNRNSLVKTMTRRIRFVKQKLNKGISGEDISKIENMIKETQNNNQQICDEDSKLAAWKFYTNNIKEIDDTMDAILKDTQRNDSPHYNHIVDSIKKYRENPTQENMKVLQNYLEIYIDIRTRHGRKKDKDFRKKGRIRIQRMKFLAENLGLIDEFDKYKEKNMNLKDCSIQYEDTATKAALTARQRRYEEFLEINRQFKVLKDASEILITERMLTPEYVKNNMKEMKGYVETIKKARNFKVEWIEKHQQGDQENERGILERKLFAAYSENVKQVLETNVGLEAFVKACETENINQIEETRSAITSKLLIKDKKVEDLYKEYKKNYLNRLVRSGQVNYIVGAYDNTVPKHEVKDSDRLASILEGFSMNDDGDFETDRDREIFENNLDFVDLLYHGSLEQLAPKVKKYFEEQSEYKVTKEMTTKDYIFSHLSELDLYESRNTFKENIWNIREGLKDFLKTIMGNNYQTEISKNDLLHMTAYLAAFTKSLGFKFSKMTLLDKSYQGDLEEIEEKKQEALEQVLEEIENRDKKNKKQKKM